MQKSCIQPLFIAYFVISLFAAKTIFCHFLILSPLMCKPSLWQIERLPRQYFYILITYHYILVRLEEKRELINSTFIYIPEIFEVRPSFTMSQLQKQRKGKEKQQQGDILTEKRQYHN